MGIALEISENRINHPIMETEDHFKTEQMQQYQSILDHQKDMLTLFSGDQRLVYQLDTRGEHFVLQPKNLTVLVPVLFFQSQRYSENRFLFHLYEALALYPDYRRSPERYLNRPDAFRPDAEAITAYFLEKVRRAGLQDDAAYEPTAVYYHMSDEIGTFLEECDTWTSILTVMSEAPVYQDPAVKADIGKMLLLEDTFPQEDNPLGIHRDLAGSLLTAEFYNIAEIGWDSIREELLDPVFGMTRYSFLRQAMMDEITRHHGIEQRDPLIHTILFPSFMKLWKEDIDRMELSKTIEEEQQADSSKKGRRRRTPSMTHADRKNMLTELNDEKQAQAKAVHQLLSGDTDLYSLGVSPADRELFSHYEQAVRPVREEMKHYWQKLIGEASREVSVKLENMPKGKLDVNALARSWPDFTEAERRQNYKGLHIFDAYELQKVTKELPRCLDISFVIDNSGSMRSGKLQPAREALTAVLLSLQDFEQYLRINAARTHQRIDVRTETWLFGTTFQKVMSFDEGLHEKQADTILSIARLDGSAGTTDDGACLQEILKEMTPQTVREQLAGKRIRMIFEVTDGASSFPGAAKKAVNELRKDHVHIQAIEIGSENDTAAKNAFQYIFGDSGLFLGDKISDLPDALIQAVQREMTDIFRK